MKSARKIKTIPCFYVEGFAKWSKLRSNIRKSKGLPEEDMLYRTIGPYQDKERNVVFGRAGHYADSSQKVAWYEFEMPDGSFRAFTADYENFMYEFNTKWRNDRFVLGERELAEIAQVFEKMNQKKPDFILHAEHFWLHRNIGRNMRRSTLRYTKTHGTLKERLARKLAEKRKEVVVE